LTGPSLDPTLRLGCGPQVAFKAPEDEVSATDDHIHALAEEVKSSGGTVKHVYSSKVMRGFAGDFSDEHRKKLEANPGRSHPRPPTQL